MAEQRDIESYNAEVNQVLSERTGGWQAPLLVNLPPLIFFIQYLIAMGEYGKELLVGVVYLDGPNMEMRELKRLPKTSCLRYMLKKLTDGNIQPKWSKKTLAYFSHKWLLHNKHRVNTVRWTSVYLIASLLAAYSAGGYAQIIPGMERGAVCESEKGVVTAGDWIADYVETQNKGLVDDGWLLRETKAWELSLCDGSWGHKLDQKQCVELAAKWERPFIYAPNYVPDGCPIPVTPKCSSILDEREIKSFFFVMNLDGVWKTGKYVEGVDSPEIDPFESSTVLTGGLLGTVRFSILQHLEFFSICCLIIAIVVASVIFVVAALLVMKISLVLGQHLLGAVGFSFRKVRLLLVKVFVPELERVEDIRRQIQELTEFQENAALSRELQELREFKRSHTLFGQEAMIQGSCESRVSAPDARVAIFYDERKALKCMGFKVAQTEKGETVLCTANHFDKGGFPRFISLLGGGNAMRALPPRVLLVRSPIHDFSLVVIPNSCDPGLKK